MPVTIQDASAAREAVFLRESETTYVVLLSNASPGGTASNFSNTLSVRLQFPEGFRVQMRLVDLHAELVVGGEHNFLVYTDLTEWGQRVGNDMTTCLAAVTLQDGNNNWQAATERWVNATGVNGAISITFQVRDYNDVITPQLTGSTGATLGFRLVRDR